MRFYIPKMEDRMNSLTYWLSYRLGMAHWDSDKIPPELEQAFQDGIVPKGLVIDLGCGTGTSAIYMATLGRQAIGIDFVPQAIARARVKARRAGVSDRTRFLVADVTRLNEMKLPQCSFALDMGCFHGLSPEGQRRYAQGLAEVLIPDGRFMLYVLDPRKEAGMSFGLTPDQVQAAFEPWFDRERTQPGAFWAQKSTWFWMKRRE